MGAPVAEPARAGPPVTGAGRALDGTPECVDLALGGQQVGLVGLVAQHLATAEVDQLEQPGYPLVQPPEHERVEPHLEHGPLLETHGRRLAGLVVDDPQVARRRGPVDPVDVATQSQPRIENGLDVEFPFGRLEPRWVLQREIAPDELFGSVDPLRQRRTVLVVTEEGGQIRLDLDQALPCRARPGR